MASPARTTSSAHELTHAVTEYSANLFYYMQSGAMNESFSDIFGESVDLSNGHGNDDPSVRWQMGEDMSIGAIRNMMDPTIFGDPGRVSDAAYFYCGRTDNGGVHWNSGVLNHSYALVVDGGTYNSRTVTPIGLAKAGKIYYRALNYYLVSGSDFLDAYTALNQSCTDLVGTSGITAADCTQLTSALDAVELSSPWPCAPAQPAAPALCAAGQIAQPLWTDDLENVTSGQLEPERPERHGPLGRWRRRRHPVLERLLDQRLTGCSGAGTRPRRRQRRGHDLERDPSRRRAPAVQPRLRHRDQL